jgi:class 3 adenylate cyclase
MNKLQALFGQHVSKEVAEELIAKNPQDAGSKFLDVTVLFADIRDFTVFAESRAPKEVGNFQNLVFGEFINIVRENKGIVLQALGDGIMAVFGAPVENETHPENAITAGHAMLTKVNDLMNLGEIPETRLGIGLHSGKVIAGEVGNEIRKFYSLSGSNVIIAARIESMNKEFDSQFLVSQSVCDRINQDGINWSYKGEHKLKGISKPVGIYQLV